jgi:hypothetical protein
LWVKVKSRKQCYVLGLRRRACALTFSAIPLPQTDPFDALLGRRDFSESLFSLVRPVRFELTTFCSGGKSISAMLLTPQGLSNAYDCQKGRVQRLLMPLLMHLFSSGPQKTLETEHAFDRLDRATPKPLRAMRRRYQNLPFLFINQRGAFSDIRARAARP